MTALAAIFPRYVWCAMGLLWASTALVETNPVHQMACGFWVLGAMTMWSFSSEDGNKP